jgi:hypothetical protein
MLPFKSYAPSLTYIQSLFYLYSQQIFYETLLIEGVYKPDITFWPKTKLLEYWVISEYIYMVHCVIFIEHTYFQTMAFSLALYLALPFMQITCTPLVFNGVGMRTYKHRIQVKILHSKNQSQYNTEY